MMTIRLRDDCTADPGRKPDDLVFDAMSGPITIHGDTIKVGQLNLYRVEPVGFGDVHWEVYDDPAHDEEPVAFRRYTMIEVSPA